MNKKQEYYGIYFNDNIPKIDKVNKYDKEVELKFEGEAYLIVYDDGKPQRAKKFENGDKLKKEKDYEIEFINTKNEIYNLQVRIETSYLFFILLLFLLGFLIGLILTRPIKNEESILERFYNFINLSIIELNIDGNEKSQPSEANEPAEQYDFDVTFNNIDSDDINFTDTINGKALAKNKIAPGTSGSFSIVLNTQKSTVDMKYRVDFIDLTDEKPSNMIFKIRGSNKKYNSLQELQNDLSGIIKAHSKKEIIIDWQWAYESGNTEEMVKQQDKIDTNNGKLLKSYKFKISVIGEEAI